PLPIWRRIMSQRDTALALRVSEVRREIYGEDGIPNVAKVLGIPSRAWQHYEAGVSIPALVILGFIQATGVEAHWLLTGEGNRYHDAYEDGTGISSAAWRTADVARRPTP